MESKAKSGAFSSAAGLAQTNKTIDSLFHKHLPPIPYIFSLPTTDPVYKHSIPYESRHIPFDPRERSLQYMTLITNGDRGVLAPKGNWEEEIYGKSPSSAAAHSSTSTPNPVRDLKKPSQKISFGDYKNFKQTGVKPSPKPNTATPEQRVRQENPGHSRNTSAISTIAPMSRVLSSDSSEHKPAAGKVSSLPAEKASARDERSSVPRLAHIHTKEVEKARSLTNGQNHREPISTKDSNKDPRASFKSESRPQPREPTKHALPPRPQSPPRSNNEHKKRPLDSGETHSEKRVKIGHNESGTPSSSNKAALSKPEAPLEHKSSLLKSQKLSAQAAAAPQPKKATPTKPIDTKGHTAKPSSASSNKPLDLPPLLSPLPADLDSEPSLTSSTRKKSEAEKTTPPKTPSKKSLDTDNIVVKHPHAKNDTSTTSPPSNARRASSPPPFDLPSLLSPGLPDIVEDELVRLKEKSSNPNTVEARHENARRPDAPGVARKTPKPQKKGAIIGHPPRLPKKDKGESSKLPTVHEKEPEKEVKKKFVVRIPYKKRQARDIQRILQLTQRPRGTAERLEVGEKLARERSTSAAPPARIDSGSEDDVPLYNSRATKTAPPSAPAMTKKRPSDPKEHIEPALKRAKLPESIDATKPSRPVTPAFKSPAISGSSTSVQKSLLATPKKGDAMKSVAMRRVDSNDSQAKTPQAAPTSAPASAEKPRPNGVEQRHNPEVEKFRADEAKLFPMGTALKRKMNSMISPQHRDPKDVTDKERKTGLCIGVESLQAYMLAFHARDRIAQLSRGPTDPRSWEDLLNIEVFFERTCRQFPELHALGQQIEALTREMLNRSYMENFAMPKDSAIFEKLAKKSSENSKARDAAWMGVHRSERALERLGVKARSLGPWSTVHDAVTFASVVLDLYSKREKLDWSPDTQLLAMRDGNSHPPSK